MSTATTTVQTIENKLEAVPQVLSIEAPAGEAQAHIDSKEGHEPVSRDESDGSNIAALSTGGYAFAGMPTFTDPYKKRQWQLEHMSGAFRVFARKGYTEGTAGHISVRDPVDPATFWINPLGKHFGMLKASDMVQINEQGQIIGGNKVAVNSAGFVIHSAIHRARPDVHAACHMHSPAGKAWSTFGRPVDIINQDSCIFFGMQAVYKSFGGVVLGQEEGQRIVQAFGDKNRVIFLQNHGILTTGATVDEAAYLFTCLERTCEVQLKVEAAGCGKNFIGDEEARFTANVNADPEALYIEFQPDFEYEIWKSKGQLSKGE